MSSVEKRRGTLRRFGLWIGGGISLALAGWGAVGLSAYGLHRLRPPPPPLDVQISDIIHAAARYRGDFGTTEAALAQEWASARYAFDC